MKKKRNKEHISIKLLKYGKILKKNRFETTRGIYEIYNILYNNCIYFAKILDDKVVEAINLSKIEVDIYEM